MHTEQPAQQADTDRDLFDFAGSHVCREHFAEPFGGDG